MANSADWIILGIGIEPNKEHIAYKQITNTEDTSFDDIDCDYPDVDIGESVTLGLWSIDEQKTVKEWVIYPQAIKQEDCITMSAAKKNLAAAKKEFKRLKIDINEHPKPMFPNEQGDFIWKDIDGKPHLLSVLTFPKIPIPTVGNKLETFDEEILYDDNIQSHLSKTWIRNGEGKVLYKTESENSSFMVSSLRISFPALYVIGDDVVLVEQHEFQSGRGSWGDCRFTSRIKVQ